MRELEYEDREGRRFLVWLPEGVPDSEAAKGVRIGPPDLASLGLPVPVEVRLNNELFHRRLFRVGDAKGRRQDVIGALMAALSLDAGRIVDLYGLTGAPPAP
jgi:hypothetical protein